MKNYLVAGAVVIALGSVFGWYRTQISLAEERGARAEAVEDYRELQAKHEADSAAAAALLAEQKAATAEAVGALETSEARLASARRTSRQRVQELEGQLAALPDSISGPVQATITALEEEAEVCSLALLNCHTVIAAKDDEIGTLTNDLASTQGHLTDANLLIDRLEQPVGGGGNWIPWVIVIVEAGIIVLILVAGA
jgi:chromosome segregation ATPase